MTNALDARPARPPINAFASVMGLSGLGLAWRFASPMLGVPRDVGEAIIGVAAIVFAVLCVMYVRKAIRHSQSVRDEYADAATSPYFGTIVISIALLAYGAVPYSYVLAAVLWAVASASGIALLLALAGRWISEGVALSKISPAWLIPVIGNATAVFAGDELGFRELSIASFSIALLYYVTILPLVFYRLIFGERLAVKSAPSLAVLISSPAVLALAVYHLSGGGMFFDILVVTALFNLLLVAGLWKMAATLPLSSSIWGYTFPLAELSGAVLRYHQSVPGVATAAIADGVLALATIVTAIVTTLSIVMLTRARPGLITAQRI